MNPVRITGHVLLWLGFIAAAAAAVCQREVDFLPESEQSALQDLGTDFKIPASQYDLVLDRPLAEYDSREFVALVTRLQDAAAASDSEAAGDETDAAGDEADAGSDQPKEKMVAYSTIENERVLRIENRWRTVRWPYYGLAVALGVIGVVLLRSTSKMASQDEQLVSSDFAKVTDNLALLTQYLTDLEKGLDKMAPEDVVDRIDKQLATPFAEFADARDSIVQKFGLHAYAEIMTEFASGERFTNRAWSAAADGYVEEVYSSVTRARKHLERAGELLAEQLDQPPATTGSP